MATTNEGKVTLPRDARATPVQALAPGTSLTITTSGTSSRATLPVDAAVVMISSTESAWIAFGDNTINAAVGGTGSFLLPGGGVTVAVPEGSTHVAAIQHSTSGSVCVVEVN